jgi:hypothetical protein
MTDWIKVLEPKLSDEQKEFFSNKENVERLINIYNEPELIKMIESENKRLFTEYTKLLKKYDRAVSVSGVIDNGNKLARLDNKTNKEIEKIDNYIAYCKEQIIIAENKKNEFEKRITYYKNIIENNEKSKQKKLTGSEDPTDQPKEVRRAKYDLEQAKKPYFENKYILDTIILMKSEIKKMKETRTTKTTTVVKETVTTTVINRKNSVVSIHSKKTVSTVHTDDCITSDTEYDGDSESVTPSLIERKEDRCMRRMKRAEKRVFRIKENEALKRRGLPEKPLSFDPENIDAN